MNTGNLIFLAVAFTALLFIVMRTQRNRLWIAAIVVLLPIFLIYRWAIYRGQETESLIGLAIGGGINLVAWAIYGRKHPPSKEGDIKVVGME
jgi:hypothetical protein